MTNINTETKGPKGVQIKESLIPGGSSGFTRGLAVVYGTDVYHAAVASVANSPCIGIIEEDAISTTEAISVIEHGQTVGQVGAAIPSAASLCRRPQDNRWWLLRLRPRRTREITSAFSCRGSSAW